MATFEWIIVLLLGAALLGAPYPTFLALGGTLLAFVPDSPNWTLDPHLALTLFVAPVLVDAAYDTSLRDLRTHWRPIAGLVIAAVGTTVIAVALVARWCPACPVRWRSRWARSSRLPMRRQRPPSCCRSSCRTSCSRSSRARAC